MSTEKELYMLAMNLSGKAMKDINDDDLIAALGVDNAITRSKHNDPTIHTNLKRNIWVARRKYGLLSDNEEDKIDQSIRLIRRGAGLNEAAAPYCVWIRVKNRTTESIIWAESRTEAALLALSRHG